MSQVQKGVSQAAQGKCTETWTQENPQQKVHQGRGMDRVVLGQALFLGIWPSMCLPWHPLANHEPQD